jgi:outer membrane receptor protein involved in Fe transport
VQDLLLHLPLNIRNQTTLTLRGGVYNVFDKKYVANGYTYSYQYAQALTTVNYYYPQAGRRWTIGLGLSF